jgi:hypothetical protein
MIVKKKFVKILFIITLILLILNILILPFYFDYIILIPLITCVLIILFLFFRKSYYKKTKNKGFWFKFIYLLSILIPFFVILFFVFINFNPLYDVIYVGLSNDTNGIFYLEENKNLGKKENSIFGSFRSLDGLGYAIYNNYKENFTVSIEGENVYLISKPKMIDYITLDYSNLNAFDNYDNKRDLLMLIDDCLYFDKNIYYNYSTNLFSLSFEFNISDNYYLQFLVGNDDFLVFLEDGIIFFDKFSYKLTNSYNELLIISDDYVELFLNDIFIGRIDIDKKSNDFFIGKNFIGTICNIKFTDIVLDSTVLKANYNNSRIPIIGFDGKLKKLKIRK